MRKFTFEILVGLLCLAVGGCGDDDMDENGTSGTSYTPAVGDAQTPPTGSAATIDDWLAEGDYQDWACEDEPHEPRSPSPHGPLNRICSDDLVSTHGDGEYPVGSASVKEVVDESDALVGYALYVKVEAGEGESFFWYEVLNGEEAVRGLGSSQPQSSACVPCHAAAGSDADHSGHDFVYTQVE